MAEDNLKDRVTEVASGPARVQGDELTVDQQSVDDLIKAARHLGGETAIRSRKRGLLIDKLGVPNPQE